MFASELLDRAARIIQDETNVRWPLSETRLWLNDAMREVALQKPTSCSKSVVLTLQAGTYQFLPGQYFALLGVTRNLKTTATPVRVGGRAIRAVQRDILDAQQPNWHDSSVVPYSAEVKHVIFDTSAPTEFHVFPGNTGAGIVEAVVAAIPTPITLPSNPEVLASYNITIDMPEVYSNVLLDYVLYRAYSKDAQYANAAQRAMAHYQQFANSLGMKVQVEAMRNPNMAGSAQAIPTPSRA